jgi:putative protease
VKIRVICGRKRENKMKPKQLELLSPAKNLECGLAAISHGADAVYIGAPKFGAREAVGNPISDIEKLAAEAHLFGAKLYVAFNTILYDQELDEASRLIKEVYEAGADALIIQDMGILEMYLPPIPLHASTQINNYTVEKIQFLEAVGFDRAVLARELSFEQIREISSKTKIELEAFVHGSLCVSLSGQCYMSHAIGRRSANRGACAQPCRKKYKLTDSNGQILSQDKHLLSLKDLNRSNSLEEMAEAGITSFKIEGRLKDIDYVKNITAYYRKKIDLLLEGNTTYQAASVGKTTFFFEPDPLKTFNRGTTDYFLYERSKDIAQAETGKSFGEELGTVTKVGNNYFDLLTNKAVSNNDGLAFFTPSGESIGLKVNSAETTRIFPDKMNNIYKGVKVFRNYDHEFQKQLGQQSAERKIRVNLSLVEMSEGFALTAIDESGVEVILDFNYIEKNGAKSPEKSEETILRQLSKSGETAFKVKDININGNEKYFFQAGTLNNMRRQILSKLEDLRKQKSSFSKKFAKNNFPFPQESFHFENNVSNSLARQFYQRHGINDPGTTFEKLSKRSGFTLMTTKHCLKYQLGYCKKYGGKIPSTISEPLFLNEGDLRFRLDFDCRNCLMKVISI